SMRPSPVVRMMLPPSNVLNERVVIAPVPMSPPEVMITLRSLLSPVVMVPVEVPSVPEMISTSLDPPAGPVAAPVVMLPVTVTPADLVGGGVTASTSEILDDDSPEPLPAAVPEESEPLTRMLPPGESAWMPVYALPPYAPPCTAVALPVPMLPLML